MAAPRKRGAGIDPAPIPTLRGVRVLTAIRAAALMIGEHIDGTVRFSRDTDGSWVARRWDERAVVTVYPSTGNAPGWMGVRLTGDGAVLARGRNVVACIVAAARTAGVREEDVRVGAYRVMEAIG